MLIMHEDFIKLASADTSKTPVLDHRDKLCKFRMHRQRSKPKNESSHELRDDVIPGVILNIFSLRLQPQTGTMTW